MINVVHFQRKRRLHGNHSIESYFSAIRDLQPNDIKIDVKISRFVSSGIFKRLYNTIEAFFSQKDINHITGDIHFVGILLAKRKTILTVHDCGFLKKLSGIKLKVVKLFWYTFPAKKANTITVNSIATKQDLLNYVKFPEDRIKVIYIFVPEVHKLCIKEFNSEKPTILQIGTAPNKNINRVAQALKGINCKFVILGHLNDETISILKQNEIDFENIDKKVSDTEVSDLYKKCDVVSFVSTLEGFGMPIVEGNVTGRVVVTSNVTSMPEIGANAAEFVNPFDIESITAGFLKVINDAEYRKQLIENGFENAKRFERTKIANEYYSLYRTMMPK